MSTKVETDTNIEVKEATNAEDEEDEVNLAEDKVEDDIVASTIGRMTTLV
jgi:hypothetical protein